MINDGQKVWGGVLSTLKSQISSSSYKTWFAKTRALDLKKTEKGDILVVAVANNFVKEQIEKRFLNMLKDAAVKQRQEILDTVFVVSEANSKQKADSGPLFSGVASQFVVRGQYDALNVGHTFANFMVGPSNNLAFLAASQVSENLASVYNPLVIYGPTGVGKTHLMQAIGNSVLTKAPDSKVLYVTSEKFTNDFLTSLKNRTQESFRQKYRNVNLLLVDDVQFFAGKESTQDEFFHTFNELVLSKRQVVIVSDRHPKELVRLKERLADRFLGGLVAHVSFPELETKMLIVKSKCEERGITLSLSQLEQIATECTGGARELEGVLIALLAEMRISGREINESFIAQTISKSGKQRLVKASSQDVISAVARHFSIKVEDLRGSSRKSSLVFARQVVMYMLRENSGLALEEIGSLLGGRDHSTIIYGVHKVKSEIKVNSEMRDEILRLEKLINNQSSFQNS